MKKFNGSFKKDMTLERMLRDRKAPLTEEAMNRLLTDLTIHIAGNVSFLAAFYPKKNASGMDTIIANDIDKADLMEGTDGERYLPVFTDPEHLKQWKAECRHGEFIYIVDKKDLLDFLNLNAKTAAAVVNPMEDDLLLYRMQLQNMIKIGSERMF